MGRPWSLRFVNAHYAPDIAATAEFLTDLAETLAGRGHSVHVVTGRSAYGVEELDVPDEEVRNGVRVTRVRTTSLSRGGNAGRFADYATFTLGAARLAIGAAPVDLTIYLTTPPLLGTLGLLGHALGRRPYGLWVMDLHPEAQIAQGMLRERGLVARALGGLDRAVFKRSRLTAVVGRCMEESVIGRLPAGRRPVVLPLWKADNGAEPVSRSENPLARQWDVGDRFVIMYSGNAGYAHRFDEVKALLLHYRDDPSVLSLFVGGGARRAELEAFFGAEGIRNARYLDYVGHEETRWSLVLADVHLVTLEPAWCGIAVPSKIFGILASARPVAIVGPRASEVSRIVEESGAGRVIDPGDATRDLDPTHARAAAEELIRFVEELRADPEAGRRYGDAGRAAFLSRYTKSAGVERWEAALREVIGP